MTNYPITASGSVDLLGDEFPSQYVGAVARAPMTVDERSKVDEFTADWVRRHWGVDLAETERNKE